MNNKTHRLGDKLIGFPVFGICRQVVTTGHVVELSEPSYASCVIYWDEVGYEDSWILNELEWDKSGKFLMAFDKNGDR